MRVAKPDQLTYEEIASLYKISPNKVHAIVKSGYNKMVNYYVEKFGMNIFDAVMELRQTMNMSEKEAFDKLDDANKIKIKEEAFHRMREKEG
jgi:predicted DNA-binding protein YlxM (UPF0122 family)